MAKAAKTAIKTKDQKAAAEAKNWSKVIKAVRSPKTGAYTSHGQLRGQRITTKYVKPCNHRRR